LGGFSFFVVVSFWGIPNGIKRAKTPITALLNYHP
jgi:hypothetical protein